MKKDYEKKRKKVVQSPKKNLIDGVPKWLQIKKHKKCD
jgi:hypothetical protein